LDRIQHIIISVFYEAYKYGIHAEKNAIMSVRDKNLLSKSKIVIVRLKDGVVVKAKPCKMCQNLLDKYKVSKICTLDEGKIVKS
jgi:cytidine deaminase